MMYRKETVKTSIVILLLASATFCTEVVFATTWSVSVNRFTDYTYYDGFPTIAQMHDGKIWLVWSKEILGNLTLYCKTSSSLGRTWSGATNLTMTPAQGNDQNPSIMQAENGTIWLAWASDRPEPAPPPLPDFYINANPASLAIPPGGTDNSDIGITSINDFSSTVSLSVSGQPLGVTATLDPTAVTPPPNGTANSTLTVSVEPTAAPGNYILNVMGRSGKIFHTINIALEITSAGGSGERALAHPLSPSSESPGLQDYEIFYKASHDNGVTWSNDIQLTDDVYDDLRPSILQLTNGTIVLFWQSNRLGNNDIFYTATNDGTSWSAPTQLTTDTGPDRGPHATQTEDGKIWVAWASSRTGDYEIFYKTSPDLGASWSDDTRLTYSTQSDSAPWILQPIDGTIMIFWSSGALTTSYDIYYKYSTDNGATWSESIQFTTDNYEDMWPSATQTNDTTIWVVWVSNRGDQPDGNWDVYYRTSLAGDVNEDGVDDVWDISIVAIAFGSFYGQPAYNPDADINKDGIVDMADLSIVAYYLGQT